MKSIKLYIKELYIYNNMVLTTEGSIKAVEARKLPDGKTIYKNYVMADGKIHEIYSVTDFTDQVDVVSLLSFNVYYSGVAKSWKVSLKDVSEI